MGQYRLWDRWRLWGSPSLSWGPNSKGGHVSKTGNEKLKILYLWKIFQEETDPEHGLTMAELIKKLKAYGIEAERKSIYRDIQALRDFDIAIETYGTHPPRYALAHPDFTLGELMLMVDAIESCRAITERQARNLVASIKTLANSYEQEKLDRRIHVVGRIKSQNRSVFGNIDQIHEALRERRQISFPYFHLDATGTPRAVHNGKRYVVTPLDIVYDEGFYYLSAWEEARQDIAEFRCDRMGPVRIEDAPADENETIASWHYAESAYEAFGRFKGRKADALLAVRDGKTEIVRDRFGTSATFEPAGDGWVLAHAKVFESDQFFGWIAGMGGMVKIAGPSWLREDWRAFLERLLAETEEEGGSAPASSLQ